MTEVVRGRRRGRSWTKVGHGLYVAVPPARCESEDRLRAWSLVLPRSAVFTHLDAARLRGWWLPRAGTEPVHVAMAAAERHPQRCGLAVTRLREPPEIETVRGLPVATAPETLLAAARDLGVLDLVPLADSALRLRHCSLDEISAAAAQRRRGAPVLRTVLPLLDDRSESPWESIMRVLHHAARIEVEAQHVVRDEAGRFVARGDLWLVGTRRLHEYDGEVHRDLAVHRGDLARDRRLLEAGWQRYGYTAAEVLRGGALIASADALLGRRWDPTRLARWRGLVDGSRWRLGVH
ncbi:MAG: hypothetical protein ACJ72K_02140 [Friedmanniella sp.]